MYLNARLVQGRVFCLCIFIYQCISMSGGFVLFVVVCCFGFIKKLN